MAVNLVEQYGVIPKALYPESFHSSMSAPLNTLLKTKLREHAIVLRELVSSLRTASTLADAEIMATVRAKKEELLAEVYTIMAATLGAPPAPDAKFTWDYYDADEKPHSWTGTPKQFFATFADKSRQTAPRSRSISAVLTFRMQQPLGLLLAHQRPAERLREALHRRPPRYVSGMSSDYTRLRMWQATSGAAARCCTSIRRRTTSRTPS
jgi:aminopeptidase C